MVAQRQNPGSKIATSRKLDAFEGGYSHRSQLSTSFQQTSEFWVLKILNPDFQLSISVLVFYCETKRNQGVRILNSQNSTELI